MKSKYWIAVLAVLLLLSAAAGMLLLAPGETASMAQIVSQGEVVRTVLLSVDQEFTIPVPGGGYNVVTVRDGKIAVTEASCPDHYCMDRGYCAGGAQIVCLPNKLVIKFLAQQEVDGVAG